MLRIRKELDESTGDYEDTADPSDKKIIPEFVGEIQAMIDKLIRSIARQIRVAEFLIRQVKHDDEDESISHTTGERACFYLRPLKDKKNFAVKLLNKVKYPRQSNMLWVFF